MQEATRHDVPASPSSRPFGAEVSPLLSSAGAMCSTARRLSILGCRGVPAAHGGFETFAEHLSLFLTRRGWEVTVYCQDEADDAASVREDIWQGVRRVIVPVRGRSASVASISFDWRTMLHACSHPGILLVLGYNTGLFAFLPRLLGRTVVINMDGIEWRRPKWSRAVRVWFWLNEQFAVHAGTVLVADHPEIARHLIKTARATPRKVVMIPYGATPVGDVQTEPVTALGLAPDDYYLVVCRLEPENNVITIIEGFKASGSTRKLVVLGTLNPGNPYHVAISKALDDRIRLPGPIYDAEALASLRRHARAYCHGHTVGGTNPSLVEALGAGCSVLAHDNAFNRWTAGGGQFFFSEVASCAAQFRRIDGDDAAVQAARQAASARFSGAFQPDQLLERYEDVFQTMLASPRRAEIPVAE